MSFENERLREVIIELERSKGRVNELKEEENVLLEAMNALMSSDDESEIFKNLMLGLKKNIEFEHGLILFKKENKYVCMYATDDIFKGAKWELGKALEQVEKGHPVCIYDISKIKTWDKVKDKIPSSVISTLSIPLKGKEQMTILMLTHSECGHFSKKDIRLATKFIPFAKQGIIMIEHQRGLNTEIRRRKKIEKDLRSLQNQLITSAYKEGFAENAISNLHNIWNLLTPMRIGIELNYKDETLIEIPKLLEKVLEHILTKTYNEDKTRNKDLSHLLTAVQKQILTYNKDQQIFLAGQLNKINEIEKITTSQKKYLGLKKKEVTNISLFEVLNDIESTIGPALDNNEILFLKDIDEDISLFIERDGFFYAMLNIIQNSLEAHDEKSKKHVYKKNISISAIYDSEKIEISICDNGIGLKKGENKNFFNFGKTTKKNGTGFGLHSAGNFIQASNGTIQIMGLGLGIGCIVKILMPVKL
jgi:signal transduction histidine kinase